MTTKIIALCAKQPRAGKDTVTDQLIELLTDYGFKVGRVAFGDALRRCVSHLFTGIDPDTVASMLQSSQKDVEDARFAFANVVHRDYLYFLTRKGLDPKKPRSLRWHMQKFGDDFIKGDQGLKKHWVDVVDRYYRGPLGFRCDYLIVTDARSEVEFEWLAKNEAQVIKIDPVFFPAFDRPATHAHPVESFDFDDYVTTTIRNVYGRHEVAQGDISEFLGLTNSK